MPRLKDEFYDCPQCGKRNHLDNAPECSHASCSARICPDCSPELCWDLEVCPAHLNSMVYTLKNERDKLARQLRAVQGTIAIVEVARG
jgi:ribosomal protein L32